MPTNDKVSQETEIEKNISIILESVQSMSHQCIKPKDDNLSKDATVSSEVQ